MANTHDNFNGLVAQAKPATPKHIGQSMGAVMNGIPRHWVEHYCPRCDRTQKFSRMPGVLCWDCSDQVNAEAARRAERIRHCGVSTRHERFQNFDDLKGPPDFIATRDIVRRFVAGGDSILALLGKRGTGKTQLASVAVYDVINAGYTARIIPALGLAADLKRRFNDEQQRDADGAWLRQWAAPHLLCLDEIAELSAGEHIRAAITRLCDERYSAMRPTILIGNIEPAQFAECVGASVADRANEGGGIVVCNGWPSFRTRATP